MDPDLFITIAFCSLVFGLAVGAGALFVRSALRGTADPEERDADRLAHERADDRPRGRSAEPKDLDGATAAVRRRGNPSLTKQGGGAQWHP
jgi:hypothetical protein